MRTIKLNIQSGSDRANVILALARAGYKVTEEREEESAPYIYRVVFEVPKEEVK